MAFCQNCGSPAQGNFCSNCGNKLIPPTNSTQQPTQQNISNNSPKFLPAFGLLLLIWASTSGQYLNTLEEYDLSQANILGIRDTLIATILMICYPFVSRIMNKQAIEYKECKTICITNSAVMLIISLILQATIGIGFIGGLGAFIYYFINMNLFSAPKNATEEIKSNENTL